MQPLVNLLHRASAHVRSFSNPTPPESPSPTMTPGENEDAPPPLPQTPEHRRDVRQTDDASADTTIVAADDVETASEKRRRKRREKEARQRQRRSGGGDDGGGGGGDGNEGVPTQGGALPGSQDGAGVIEGGGGAGGDDDGGNERREEEDEGVPLGGRALPGSGNGAVVNEDDGSRVRSQVEPDAEAGEHQIQIVKADDGGKAIRVTVEEVGEEDDDYCQDGREGESMAEEQRLFNRASNFEPERNERNAIHSEPRLVDPTSNNATEHDELVKPTFPEPQVVISPSTSEPERVEHDPRRSAQRLLAAHANKKSPSQTTTPTIKQLYPKHGLGPTIEVPSKPERRFTIDNLDPPLPPTTTPRSLPSQPLPNLPKSLDALQAADFTDPLRAAHMSSAAHNLLADRLWRTVQFANYFYSPPARTSAIVVRLPPTFHSMNPRQQRLAQLANRPPPPQYWQEAVENGVASFLSRTRKTDAEMNKFTRANRDMAFYLQTSLALERVVTKREMFEMFEASYGKGGEEGVDWRVDMIGLGVVFDGGDSWRRIDFQAR